MDARSGGHHEGEQNFIGARSISESDFHGIEMTAYVGRIDVRDGDVEARAEGSDFLCGGDDRLRAPKNFTHRVAAGDVPQSAVLDFAARSDDRTLAIAFDNRRVSTQSGNQGARHFQAKGLEVVHEAGDFLYVGTGERVMD